MQNSELKKMEVRLHERGEVDRDPEVLARRGRILPVPDHVTDCQSLHHWLVAEHRVTEYLSGSFMGASLWIPVESPARTPPARLPAGGIFHFRSAEAADSSGDNEGFLPTDEVAFQLPYFNLGDAETLYKALELSSRMKENSYAPAVSLFQSSGWGKSRAVCELWRMDVQVVYCSLANPRDFGYPRRSWIADWFLQQCGKYVDNDIAPKGQLACMTFCLAFFGACIRIAKTRLQEGYQEFVTNMWKGGRHFWEQVKAATEIFLAQGMLAGLVETFGSLEMTWAMWEDRSAYWLRNHCPPIGSSRLQVLFVFDEARHLVHRGPMKSSLFIPIRRSTRAFHKSGVCALFMDTSAEISNFEADSSDFPGKADPSDRLSTGLFKIAPPIWACFTADASEESFPLPFFASNKFADIVCDVRAVQYGRPLWWAIFLASLKQGPTPSMESLTHAFEQSYNLAKNKLLGGCGKWDELVVAGKNFPAEAALSLLGPTVAIDVDPRSDFTSKLVANSLLTVISVSASRELVWTAWSPEPLVAMAATEGVRTLHKAKRYNDLYDPVVEGLQDGWIEEEFEGELVSRIILLHAMEKAIDSDRTVLDKKLAGCCTLNEFCKHLVGHSFFDLLSREPTENEQKLAGARLRFNSFHRIFKKSSELDFGDVKMCIERQCAAICRANTWGDDLWLFAFLGSDDEDLMEDNVTVVHVQVKQKIKSDTKICLAKMSPEFSGLKIGFNLPYLSLYMNVMDTGKEAEGVSLVDARDIESYVKCHANAYTPIREALKDDGPHMKGKAAGMMDAEGTAVPMDVEEGETKKKQAVQAWRKWFQANRELQYVLVVKHLNGFHVDDELKEILRKIVRASKTPFHTYPNHPFYMASLNLQKPKLKDMFKFVNVQNCEQGM